VAVDSRYQGDVEASKLVDGQILVERVVPKLVRLTFCKKVNSASWPPGGTKRFSAILTTVKLKIIG